MGMNPVTEPLIPGDTLRPFNGQVVLSTVTSTKPAPAPPIDPDSRGLQPRRRRVPADRSQSVASHSQLTPASSRVLPLRGGGGGGDAISSLRASGAFGCYLRAWRHINSTQLVGRVGASLCRWHCHYKKNVFRI